MNHNDPKTSELVDRLTSIAAACHDSSQLRERIAGEVFPVVDQMHDAIQALKVENERLRSNIGERSGSDLCNCTGQGLIPRVLDSITSKALALPPKAIGHDASANLILDTGNQNVMRLDVIHVQNHRDLPLKAPV